MKDIFTEIKLIMKKESRLGYGDSAVFGGFSDFISEKLQHHQDSEAKKILALTKEYSRFPRGKRREVLIHAAHLLLALEEKIAKENQSDSAALKEPMALQYVKNVGPKRVGVLKKLGIYHVEDLITYFPKRHEDRREITPMNQLVSGENAVITGVIQKSESYRLKKNMTLTKAYIGDETSSITAVWFNQTWLKDQLKTDRQIYLYGRADFRYGKRQFIVSEHVFSDDGMGFGILPIYHLTEGINQKLLRSIIKSGLEVINNDVIEYFPAEVRQKYTLVGREWAIAHYHFPEDLEELQAARRRIVFDEFFMMRLGMGTIKENNGKEGIIQDIGELKQFQKLLPFTLTDAQLRSLREIYYDMENPIQMMRLLEGDVGSGKTAVAAGAIYRSWQSGHQSALMAPTEILARQHYQSLKKLFGHTRLQIAMLTGATKIKEKNIIYEDLATGKIDLLIGTHALVEDKVAFRNLALVIIDEQHRFGVKQREKLVGKGNSPDTLALTATPIPRTLAMSVFADLDISALDEKPPGRQQIKTMVMTGKDEMKALQFIKEHAQKGEQSFIVCPLVEESESLDLAAATDLYHRLQQGFFRDITVGLIHGKMKQAEKDSMMEAFRKNEIAVLISTTVIEVGVDVSNATIMMVRDAQRFGLAQLHQMRGRIGRGEQQSFCILEYSGYSEIAKKRMEIMVQYDDGFKIAEEDLKLRGPGDFFGLRQHGIADMQVADLYVDHDVLVEVSHFTTKLLKENPHLEGEQWQNLRAYLKSKRRMF